MKSLLLVRHAKSSWSFDLDDFDRPLNQRGNKDAPEMALRLKKKNIVLDLCVTSPAKRALTTANHFATLNNVNNNNVIEIANLYEPTMDAFIDAVRNLDNTITTVAIFSHNPVITYFVNTLTETKIDDMPTCGIFATKINTDQWKDFSTAEKEFWFFDYPKSN